MTVAAPSASTGVFVEPPVGYVRLALRFDRLLPGFVDGYIGEPALAAAVAGEPRPEPAGVAAEARTLRLELASANLTPDRVAFLDGQLRALECAGRWLAGEPVGFVRQVREYYGVRIRLGDPDEYAAVHTTLRDLLPGRGMPAQRLAEYRRRDACPPERLESAVRTCSTALREIVRREVPLPDDEAVDYHVVTDRPWTGFNHYRSGYRSMVAINADQPHALSQLPHLVAHEAYPGHHTERCRKEALLALRAGRIEHTISCVSTPESLVAEGLADLGLEALVGPRWGQWAQTVLSRPGRRVDGELAERVATATALLGRVRQDAALLLHDRGRDEDEVLGYLQRWGLLSLPRARQVLRFLIDPLRRAYTTTYVEGRALLTRWLSARPAGIRPIDRFRRLLDEPLTPARIAGELAS